MRKILSEEKIQQKIDSLLIQLQEKTGVSNDELEEFKNIINHADYSQGDE